MTDNNPLADAGGFLHCDCGCSRFWRGAGVTPTVRPDGTEAEGRCLAYFPLPRWLPTGHRVEIFRTPLSDPAQRIWTAADPIVIETIEA